MKPNLLLLIFSFAIYIGKSQSIIFKGRVKCNNQNENSTKGASNVVIVPTFKPSASTITVSQPTGYFEFNSNVPLSALQDKTISIFAMSRCAICKETMRRIFVSEDQDRQNRNDDKLYVTVKDWILNANCNNAELKAKAADSILRMVIQQPDLDLNQMSNASAIVSAPSVLNFLAKLSDVVSVSGFPSGGFTLDSIGPGNIHFGQSFFASPLLHSMNAGFNFSPIRDMSEAVFWNPSSLANSNQSGNLNFISNFKNNLKLNGYYRLNNRLTIGAGMMGTQQIESRIVFFRNEFGVREPIEPGKYDSVKIKNLEYRFNIAGSYKLNKKISIGMSIQYTIQHYNYPDSLFVGASGNDPKIDFFFKPINIGVLDFNVSSTYKINPSLTLGINLMNLAGSTLNGNFINQDDPNKSFKLNQRSIGFGVTYKLRRFNFGVDGLFAQNNLYDCTVGVSYVPFNNAILSAGYAVKHSDYYLSLKLQHFRMGYIQDRNWLVAERKTTVSDFFKGRFYTGFMYDFK